MVIRQVSSVSGFKAGLSLFSRPPAGYVPFRPETGRISLRFYYTSMKETLKILFPPIFVIPANSIEAGSISPQACLVRFQPRFIAKKKGRPYSLGIPSSGHTKWAIVENVFDFHCLRPHQTRQDDPRGFIKAIIRQQLLYNRHVDIRYKQIETTINELNGIAFQNLDD